MALVTAQAEGGGFDWRLWGEGAMNNLPPLWMLKYLPNMLACHVTIVHGAEGASNTITCAEASGLLSVGEAVQVIRRGDADASIAGGVESKLNLMGQLRLELAHRLASAGEEAGAEVVRAYDDDAGGGVLGEGGGLLIVECAAGASERGARVYAEVAGVGGGHDGPALMHQENATGESEGLVVAIEAALADAGIGPGEIDAIVPHASGAGPADRAEAWALRRVFGERLASIELVTVSANVGECMAGAGAIALGVGARCLFEQRLPARIHAGRCWEDLRAYECGSREARLGHVLVCTNSMGGQNAAIVLRATGT
jgi:3-oxoacyl-[acyl-carrier-protein] synthase II